MQDHEFYPKGAIAFLLSMMGFFVVIYLGLYYLMLSRGA
jgi:hypothetical protein